MNFILILTVSATTQQENRRDEKAGGENEFALENDLLRKIDFFTQNSFFRFSYLTFTSNCHNISFWYIPVH